MFKVDGTVLQLNKDTDSSSTCGGTILGEPQYIPPTWYAAQILGPFFPIIETGVDEEKQKTWSSLVHKYDSLKKIPEEVKGMKKSLEEVERALKRASTREESHVPAK